MLFRLRIDFYLFEFVSHLFLIVIFFLEFTACRELIFGPFWHADFWLSLTRIESFFCRLLFLKLRFLFLTQAGTRSKNYRCLVFR